MSNDNIGSVTGAGTVAVEPVALGLLGAGPGSKGPATIPIADYSKGPAAGVWGYAGPFGQSPDQNSSPPFTCGVYGFGSVVGVNGYGLAITNPDSKGVGVIGYGGGIGVYGISATTTTETSGAGVWGANALGYGVVGTGLNGVHGVSTAANGIGVRGDSAQYDGVQGESQSSKHAGISARNTGGGVGVWASGNPAGRFEGDVLVTGDVVLVNSSGDIAEDFDVEDSSALEEPGTVLVIGSTGKLRVSDVPYDTRVAGVVAGAGELRPAIVLQRMEACKGRSPVALIGKAFCKVDASFGSINAGDLLTTSPNRGHAMKVLDRTKATGAVLGKALQSLANSRGLIPILITPH